jgi:hypothetical protein
MPKYVSFSRIKNKRELENYVFVLRFVAQKCHEKWHIPTFLSALLA